nr:hypothetical protein CFP56_35671 [Quercus suber]
MFGSVVPSEMLQLGNGCQVMEGETSSAHNEKPNDKTESPITVQVNKYCSKLETTTHVHSHFPRFDLCGDITYKTLEGLSS